MERSAIRGGAPRLAPPFPSLHPGYPPRQTPPPTPFPAPPPTPFLQILGGLSGLLRKAEAHCKAKNIQPDVLLTARLYPDMFPLTRQIQTVCDFAAKSCARLTGS